MEFSGKEAAQQFERKRLEQRVVVRDCRAVRVPEGTPVEIEAETEVTVLQQTAAGVTVQVPVLGMVCSISQHDADALGLRTGGIEPRPRVAGERDAESGSTAPDTPLAQRIASQLERVVDPELPLDVVALGLIYDTRTKLRDDGKHSVEIDMTLTTPSCGMGNVIADDVVRVVGELDDVADVQVNIVWEPAWSPTRISQAGRRKLGITGP